MISQRDGDLFTSGARTLVNPVNCVGVSGKGLAREFKKRFPQGDRFYRNSCIDGSLKLGRPVLWTGPTTSAAANQWVVYFPTKGHWRDSSKLANIQEGLRHLRLMCQMGHVPGPIAMPALGCGNGSLDFDDVRPLIVAALDGLLIDVLLYAPME